MMNQSLLQATPAPLIAIIIFSLIFASYLYGHFIRAKSIKKDSDKSKVELSSLTGTLLGLLGLLLAFTFSMSSSRYDKRRELVVEEANDIGTAVLRADIYPDSVKQLLRNNFKEYVEARIAFYQAGLDKNKVVEYYNKADSIGKKIWAITANYAKTNDVITRTSQLIPALNAMIDITTTRRAAGEANIPDSIMYFLFILCLGSAFLLGYDNEHKVDWILLGGLAVMLSITVFSIVDLDRPRSGLINMDTPNQKIIELRDMFDAR